MSSGVHAHAEFEVRRRSEVNLRRASMGWALFTTMMVACAPAEIDEPVEAQRSALTQVTGFGANPGGLAMFVHVPASLPPNPALVVAMHGCTQSAAAYANAGWNALADQYGFIVLYPQTTANNACFSWFIGAQQSRSGAEVTSIVNMVNHLRTTRSVDPSRVYVTGLSAGGAMTSVLLATHPDVFRAGAVMAGLPFACAQTQLDAFNCMNAPPDRTPQQWGDLVRAVPGTAGLPAPRVSIWHGTSDFTVRPGNLTELVDQWTNVNAVDAVADATSTVGPATRREYRNVQGQTRVESWTISNMSHGTAVDPRRGCGTAGAFILDVQVCSSRFAAEFFGLAPMTSLDAGSPVPDAGPFDAGVAPSDAGAVDSGTPDAGAEDAGTRPDAGGFVCRDFTAANFTHLGALRATACGGGSANFCAVGSGDDLGTVNAVTSVREVAPGFFERGTCAGGAGGGAAGGGTAGGGSAGGGSSGGSAFTCVEHAGFNYEHVVAFRAQSCPAAAAACAVGSGDNLGLFSNRTTLREVRPGYYELGACPSGAGGGSATGGGSGGSTAGGVAGGASGGTPGGSAGGTSGGSAGGTPGGSAGGASGGTSGGSAGGASGGASGGSSGGSAGGASGGMSGGSSGGASGGTSGGTAGGSAGGASGASGGTGGAAAGGMSGGAATGGGGGSSSSTNGCGSTGGAGGPLLLLVLAILRQRGANRRLKRSAASSAPLVVVVSQA